MLLGLTQMVKKIGKNKLPHIKIAINSQMKMQYMSSCEYYYIYASSRICFMSVCVGTTYCFGN